ncbi:hypothetical protein COLO4_36400 [Corchorus olitorius]|uniref:Niemann-Pick C1 N-terminal domain-containing protein n=1 Tax=Corchorus olitorius TaxID=93759 RepID=A0A1R3G9A6_9ROSI|nr:hypothetical protein COLO4_36400 [Corchorus olitorius]
MDFFRRRRLVALPLRERHSEGYCAMYDICGTRSDGKVLNCPVGSPAVKVKNNLTVDGIDFYITDSFGEGLYESCKDVKFGTMNTRALEFIGAGAKNFKEWFAFIGRRALPNLPGSPYAIQFKPSAPESSGMKPMNVSTYSCGDVSLGCSCGDCPASPVCSITAQPPSHKGATCSVRMGSLKVTDYFSTIVFNQIQFP